MATRPGIVGTAQGSGVAGAGAINVTPPAGARAWVAFAWVGEHHLLTAPSGWVRQTYWTNSGGLPMNYYVAAGPDTPGSAWTWGSYLPPEEYGFDVTVNVVVIGLDRELVDTTTTSAQSYTGTALTPATGGALALTVCGSARIGSGPFTAVYPSGWTLGHADQKSTYVDPTNGTIHLNLSTAAKDLASGSSGAPVWSYTPSDLGDLPVTATVLLYGGDPPPLSAIGAATATSSTPNAVASLVAAPVGTLDAIGSATATSSTPTALASLVTPSTEKFVHSVEPTERRYFLDQYGQPILWRMETNWFIAARDPSVWPAYLANRKAKGFNVIQIGNTPANEAGGGIPDDDNGNPYQDAGDGNPFDLSDAYTAKKRAFIDLAATYGITVAMNLGFGYEAYGSDTPAELAAYLEGAFGTASNLVWGLGVDYDPSDWAASNSFILALMAAIRGLGDTRPWYLQNGSAATIATDNTAFLNLIGTEAVYAYFAQYDVIRRAYNANQGPAFLLESNYELENNMAGPTTTDETLRRQALWTMTNGGVGWDYGHRDVWRPNSNWQTVLNTTALSQLKAIHDAFLAIDWWKLVPDQANTFLTSGQGTKPTSGTQDGGTVDPLESTYATAAVAADGSVGVVYVPTGRSFTVGLSRLGFNRSAYRVDPTNGAVTSLAVASSYTSPGNNAAGQSDWLYVFEADAIVPSSGPRVTVGGVEMAGTSSVMIAGVETAAVVTVMAGGVEVPLT